MAKQATTTKQHRIGSKQETMSIKKDFNRKDRPNLAALTYGMIPPQAPELEEAVLGVLMLEKDRLSDVMGIIPEPECFYVDANQKIYAAILRLHEKGNPVDLLTVTEELRNTKELEIVGGAHYLTKVTMAISSGAHVETHARIVMEKFMLRESIRVSGEIISDAYDGQDPFDIQVKFLEGMNRIFEAKGGFGWVSASDVAKSYLSERYDRLKGKAGKVISTTFPYVDAINGGFRGGNFIIIAARPAVGKSAIVLPMITETAATVGPVGVINLEMTNTQTFGRLVSQDSGIGYTDIEKDYIGESKLIDHVSKLSKLPVYFSTQNSMNINGIVSAATWLKKKKGIQLLVIDYLQLIQTVKGHNRENEVSNMSRALKLLALALDIPVIALSQLNRESEKRNDKKPHIGDLRESGSLEQDADIVFLIHRDWQSGIFQNADGSSTEFEADLLIPKWRNGKPGSVKLHFNGPTMRFTDPTVIETNHHNTMRTVFNNNNPF